MVVSAAPAGILDALGLKKKAEPQTLDEACDINEIKKICPEVVIGSKSMTECLVDNVKSLSRQCADFVKKSVAAQVDSIKSDISGDAAAARDALTAKSADAAQKEAAQKEAAEKTDALKTAGDAARQFGNSIKSLF